MPKATVSQDTTHVDLRTCPGGFVKLRQLPYAEMLARRDIITKMSLESVPASLGAEQKDEIQRAHIEMANLESNRFTFRHCIVEHNLEDDNGKLLDFKDRRTLERLDPKIGMEIEEAIDKLNQEDEEELQNFTEQPSSSSTETQPALSIVSE